ncbi:MAG TPA: glycosyltransferase [Stellaceae bacterium]|nr:glycosyltransferase [Stellaceae bacterium]
MTPSVLLYVQHLLGIGHARRAMHLAQAIAAEGMRVTVVSGGEPLPSFGIADATLVQLPPIKARDAGFKDLVDEVGDPVNDRLRQTRREALLAAFAATRPDAVVIEAFPFGRRAFRFELDPLIDAAHRRDPPALVLCSLRDIVVMPADPRRWRDTLDRVIADLDAVLVHGDPSLVRLDESFPPAAELADRLIYTGYVAAPDRMAELAEGAGEVLVSAGGGAVGGTLLVAALAARRQGCLADLPWRLLAGPNLPQAEYAALAQDLPDRVVLERYRAEFPQMLRHCRLSISQAGYNTVLDLLAAHCPAVLVPFAAERETEQTLRAEKLAARGIVEIVPERELTADRLAAAIGRAVTGRPPPLAIDIGGAGRSARIVAEMIAASASDVRNFVTQASNCMIEK